MALAAVRPIDLAIFASLAGLWIGGVVFIVALYRWIARFEAESGPTLPDAVPAASSELVAERPASRVGVVVPQHARAREALARS